MRKIRVALIKPSLKGHIKRGTGVYLKNLYKKLQQIKTVSCKLVSIHDVGQKSDIVHFPYFDPFFLTLPFLKKKPTVITIHDLIPLVFPQHFPKGLRGNIKWGIQKRLAKKSDAVITDSKISSDDIISILDVDKEKTFPIYLSADTIFGEIKKQDLLERVKTKYNLPEKFVLYVGDVNWNKNVLGLIKAVKEINVSLVLVSSTLKSDLIDLYHPSNTSIRQVKAEIKNDKRFYVLDTVSNDDLVVIYNLATLFAMPSFYEGFGLPVVEAFACGCPVVCSDQGSLKEVAGDASYVIDPYDINNIANGIGEIYFNEGLQRQYAKKGEKQVKRFSWKKTAKETLEVYKKVLGT